MRLWVLGLALLLPAIPSSAQRHKLTINTETPEGQLLQQIGVESDAAKKLALMEQFVAQYPKHEAVGWVYSQMVPAYTKAGQYDKALAVGEKLLALDPEDVETAHACLKAAEAAKNPDAINTWAARTFELARKVSQTPKPQDEDEAEEWKRRVDFSKQVATYAEYSLYAAALQAPEASKKIELVETLERLDPESQYLPKVYSQYFLALQQSGNQAKAVEVAEKILKKEPNDADMLLAVADYNLRNKKDLDKVRSYSGRLVELMGSSPKPAAMSDADWEHKKTTVLGLAHWMAGVADSMENKFSSADKELREALPLIQGNEQLLAAAYFHLGLANYKMQKILDAIKFNEECAKIKSPFQAQARRNLAAIRSQYRVVR